MGDGFMKSLFFGKKWFGFLCLFLVIMCLSGCGKELSNQEAFCKSMQPNIKKYKHNKISYTKFLELSKVDYDKYCLEDNNIICITIKNMNNSTELDLELEDCSKSTEKDACELKNKIKRMRANNKEVEEKNVINNLTKKCKSIKH